MVPQERGATVDPADDASYRDAALEAPETTSPAEPPPILGERWLEKRIRPYRFGMVFVLIVASYAFMATAPSTSAARLVTTLLEGVTLLMTLVAARSGRWLFRIALVVVVVAVLAAAGTELVSGSVNVTATFFALNVLLVAAGPVAIARSLLRRDVVDVHTVMGAVCIYLLIGIMYAFLFATIQYLGTRPFFVQTASPDLSLFLYFSSVTQTTVGYGDYTAATHLGRTLATTEALLGQIYLVTVVAVVVSRVRRREDRS
jgi:hypothetical protein